MTLNSANNLNLYTNEIINLSASNSINFACPNQIFTFSNGIKSGMGGPYVTIYNPGNGNPQYLSTPTSSIKYKENILPLEEDRYNIENFMKLKPIQYTNKQSKITELGFIAEDFDELGLKELVYYKDNDIEYLYYERLTSFIVKIVQEQQKKIEELEDKISSMNQNV